MFKGIMSPRCKVLKKWSACGAEGAAGDVPDSPVESQARLAELEMCRRPELDVVPCTAGELRPAGCRRGRAQVHVVRRAHCRGPGRQRSPDVSTR